MRVPPGPSEFRAQIRLTGQLDEVSAFAVYAVHSTALVSGENGRQNPFQRHINLPTRPG